MARTRKTPEERDAQLSDLHAKLAAEVEAITTGADWLAWLRFADTFHRYSFGNLMLIFAQRPDASRVAGFHKWKELGRSVRKGEKGIAILRPNTRRITEEDKATGEERTRTVVSSFGVTYVWDVSQTDGEPLPENPARPVLLAGEAPAGAWEALAAEVVRRGYTLERGDCGGANGWTSPDIRTVRVRDDVDDAQAVKTLAHELAHVVLHSDLAQGEYHGCRGRWEVEAESVAYLIVSSLGLSTGAYTFPYVASWAAGGADTDAAEVVRSTGTRVMTAARALLTALEGAAVVSEGVAPEVAAAA